MLVIFDWHQHETPDLECDLPTVPRHDESVALTFAGQPEHLYRVLWVRWYPQAVPPYVSVHVVSH